MRNLSTRSKQPCDGEPILADLLNDPVLQSLLAGDRIARADLEAVIRSAQRRLGSARPVAPPPVDCCA